MKRIDFSTERNKRLLKLVREGMSGFKFEDEKQDEHHTAMIHLCCSGNAEAREYVIGRIRDILRKSGVDEERLEDYAYEIYKKQYGLGVIDELVRNGCRKVNNIEVLGKDRIEYELYDGTWHSTRLKFDSDEELRTVIRRAVQHDYKPDINDDNCMMESKAADGSRITAILRPAGDRDYLFIKMFSSFNPTGDSYLRDGSVTPEIIKFTRLLLKAYLSIAVIGGINRGKTAFLKYLAGFLEPGARIGTLEPDFEMQLRDLYPERNIVSLQEHPNFPMSDGFKKLLRTNRDVIIVGEARGREVADAAKAARRGIGCTMLTAHVVDPESLPEEFADMYAEGGGYVDTGFLMYRFAKAFNVTYRLRQLPDGRRVVDDISEIVAEPEGMRYRVNRLFRYDIGKDTHIRVGGIEQERLIERMRYYNLNESEIEYLTYRPAGEVG